MSTRLRGWLAAIVAMLIMLALVVVELTDVGQRRWWASHPLTTDTVAGLLVLLVTVLVVNQLISLREAAQRGHAVAAQAAILVAQAARSVKSVSSVLDESGDRLAASDGFQTYMMMLLISAPVLLNDSVARRFLERAQYLGGVMARVLARADRSRDAAAVPRDSLDEAMHQLRSASAPLLELLSPESREALQGVGQPNGQALSEG